MNRSLQLETRAVHGLTARLRLAVRLLQLSSLDYEQELQEMAGKNPFLEVEGGSGEVGAGGAEPWTRVEPVDAVQAEIVEPYGAGPADEAPGSETDLWLQSASGTRDGGKEGSTSAVDLMIAEVDLRSHLQAQADLLRLSDRDRTLVFAIIESLDDDGYLRTPLDEIALLIGGRSPADPSELATALKLVQSLEPSGVGARTAVECLRLQLAGLPDERRALAARILDEQLERLARRDTGAIARALGRPVEEIEALCAAIRRLDPRPARHFDQRQAHYIVPDVIVRKLRGRWEAQLNPAAVPQVRLNQSYADLFRQHRNTAHKELATHLEEARWTVRNVEQRYSTILSVAQSILKRQYAFFEHGPLAMKPLALGEIAAEIGVHESTVCRVTNNKYMATPAGVIELKTFFSRPMALASGGAASGVAIRELVREMIEDEDGPEALSDGDIARRLSRQGITITRRTVTKYRGMLQLPPAEQRKRARVESDALARTGDDRPMAAARGVRAEAIPKGASTPALSV